MVNAMGPRRWPHRFSPSPNVVEIARKRATLLTDVVSYLARYQIALKALADFERRQGNPNRVADLKDIYHSLDSTKQQFGIDVDDAHAQWVNLRQLSRPE
jgi:hypothetical protein